MAEIYEKQGAYAEAIKIYTTLSESQPDKAGSYNKKIAKLTKKLND
jgi:ABC-type Zn uptake system ZnuABC Zn-binding protein ZnuA